MIRPLIPAALCLTLALVATGCSRPPPPQAISHQTTHRATEPARVAVLPFWMGDKVGRSAGVVGETFAASLREQAHHEVILVSTERRRAILPGEDVLAVGSITADELIKLREELHVDAIILGRIEQFESFDPVSIGMSVHLVSCLDGEVLWSATAHLDSARDAVQQDLKHWYGDQTGTGNTSIAGWKSALSSPSLFSRYACDRLVETMAWKD